MRRIRAISIAIGLSVIILGVALGMIDAPWRATTPLVQAALGTNRAARGVIPHAVTVAEENAPLSDQGCPHEDLTEDEWHSLQAQMHRTQYQFTWQVREDESGVYGAYRAPNHAHSLDVALSTLGLKVTHYGHRSETSPNKLGLAQQVMGDLAQQVMGDLAQQVVGGLAQQVMGDSA